MYIPGTRSQSGFDPLYDASGTTVGGVQLIRPQVPACSHLLVQNLSATVEMQVEFGSARATAALTGGKISSITVTNGGFGFTYPPIVRFAGGGNDGNSAYLGLNQPGGAGPNSSLSQGRPAQAHAILTGGVVTSIVIDDPGAGYVIAPYVFITNSVLDPYGCASPFFGSTISGVKLAIDGGSYYMNGTRCPTDAVALYCATAGQGFTFKWMA